MLTTPCTLLNMVLKAKKKKKRRRIVVWVQNVSKCSSCLPAGCMTDGELYFTDVAPYHKRICISGKDQKSKLKYSSHWIGITFTLL